MSTLDGKTIASTFKDLLQVSNNNAGVDDTIRYVEDGEGTRSALAISTSMVELSGDLVPAQDVTFDIGSATHRFKDLYLSGNTIHLGDATFSTSDLQALKDVQTIGVSNLPTFSEVATPAQGAKADSAIQPNDTRDLMPFSNMSQDIGSAANHWMYVYTHHLSAHGDVIVGGSIHGPATLTIDPAAVGDNTGKVVIAGDLQVDGDTTTVNSTELKVSDKTITVGDGATDATQVDGAGVEVAGSGATITYTSDNDSWNTNKTLIAPTLQSENTVTEQLNVTGNAAIDQMDLTAIEQIKNDQAVAVFIYDTSKDSDGGAWRHRVTHTSWYNETLNTSTRGDRKEFPAVAVIVAEADKVTIYDGDDPDLPMWMVFNADVAGKLLNTTGGNTSLVALNGDIFVGCSENVYGGVSIKIAFISDTSFAYANNQITQWPTGISGRDSTVNYKIFVHSYGLVSLYVNDVAMTILPNAPIDADTGLPVPTIAVATDGGVSVIRDDGSVVDYTCTYSVNNKYSLINFIGDSKLLACSRNGQTYPTVFDIPSQDKASFDSTDIVFSANPSDGSSAADIRVGNYSEYKDSVVTKENIAMGGASLIISNIDNISGDQTADNVIISSSYNTGWMPGDIKLAALSDTVSGAIGTDFDPPELIVNGGFDTDVSGWTNTKPVDWANSTLTWENGQAVGYRAVGEAFRWHQAVDTVVGAEYVIQAKNITGPGGYFVTDVVDATTPWVMVANDGAQISDTNQYKFTAVTPITYITLSLDPEDVECRFDGITMKRTNQLVLNGGFDSNIDGWTAFDHAGITPTIEHDSTNGGRLKIDTIGSYTGAVQTISDIKPGKYVVSANFEAGTQDEFYVQVAVTGEETYLTHSVDLTNTNQQIEFDVPAGTTSIDVCVRGGVGIGIFYADNISVRQTGELITNGTFDDGTSGWTAGTEATISVDSATTSLKVEQGTSDFVACSQPMNTIVGKKYTISFNLLDDGNSSVSAGIYVRSSQFSGGSNIISAVSNGLFGPQSATFTATGTVVYIEPGMLSSADNIYGLFDNISVRLAEEDRSVNDNGLQVVGRVDKTPVALGAEIVAYSGFSTDNYLTQPYNPDLDFGAEDFSTAFWFKIVDADGGAGFVFDRGGPTNNDPRFCVYHELGNIYLYTRDSSDGFSQVDIPLANYENKWTHFVMTRNSNGLMDIFANGVKVSSAQPQPVRNIINNYNPELIVGTRYTKTNPVGGSVALLRISKTAPTAEQIAKMYRDERELFQPGAQATLFGGSDAVTALSHDGELLHVGTSEGKSQFRGLRRVAHHDTPINNFISTGADFTIEQ